MMTTIQIAVRGIRVQAVYRVFTYWLNGKASEFYAAGNTPGIDAVKTFAIGYRF